MYPETVTSFPSFAPPPPLVFGFVFPLCTVCTVRTDTVSLVPCSGVTTGHSLVGTVKC